MATTSKVKEFIYRLASAKDNVRELAALCTSAKLEDDSLVRVLASAGHDTFGRMLEYIEYYDEHIAKCFGVPLDKEIERISREVLSPTREEWARLLSGNILSADDCIHSMAILIDRWERFVKDDVDTILSSNK